MLLSLKADNFKSLCRFSIGFSPLTVLIGANSAGKSSVLHAIDLLAHFATDNVNEFLAVHNWKPADLKSKHYSASQRNMTFSAEFLLNNHYRLRWDVTLLAKKEDVNVNCVREKIVDLNVQRILLSRENKKLLWYDFAKNKEEEFPEIQLSGSMLALINSQEEEFVQRFPELTALKSFLVGIKSFDLLTPEKIKKTSRYVTDLGIGGERLGAFLHGLNDKQRKKINEKLKELCPCLDKISTYKEQNGQIHMQIKERFRDNGPYFVRSDYISDGLLRIIAIISLAALSDKCTALLLDEIEDGINPSLAGDLIEYLNSINRDVGKQIMVITHSPVMLNYFDSDRIVFLWRHNDGATYARKMFDTKEMREHLQYMNPGEVWLNMGQHELEEAMLKGMTGSFTGGENDS